MNNSQKIRSTIKHFPMIAPLCLLTYLQRTFTGRIAKLRIGMASLALLIMTTSFITPRAYAANLLFKTNFGSDAMLYAPNIAYSTAGWQDFASTDLLSGSIKPISVLGATTSGFDMIADAPVTSSTLGNYMTNEIQQVTGPAGNQVYALFQNLKKNNAGPPTNGASQDAFMLHRNGVKGDTGDFYYTYWFKFQSDLHTQLGTSGDDSWRVMSEWKTGKNGDDGDYRVGTAVIKDSSGHLYWHTQGDDIAGVQSQGNIYWIVDNTTVPVPVGKWFKYEVFLHRSSGGDGRYWAAVNGQKIVDHSGPNMGVNNLPINRLFLNNAYSGGKAPLQQWTTGLEIWDSFPCGVGVSCYKNTNK